MKLLVFSLFLTIIGSAQADEVCKEMTALENTMLASFSPAQCRLIPQSTMNAPDGLPAQWAQMRTGSDLVIKEMEEEEKKTSRTLPTIKLGNLDTGVSLSHTTAEITPEAREGLINSKDFDHATKVVNIMAGKDEGSTSSKTKITFLRDVYTVKDSFLKAVEESKNSSAEIINLEVHTLCEVKGGCRFDDILTSNNTAGPAISQLARQKIVVAAGGNYYPNGSGNSIINDENLIVVGSSDPFGLVSFFSDESSDVTILAPSDFHMKVKGVKGDTFGGTSGATPQVTAAVANVKSILGDLNGKEASRIITLSATKLRFTEAKPQKNGAGQINHYRSYHLAKKLLENGWPRNKEELLEMAKGWNFKSEAANLLASAKKHLEGNGCNNLQLAFNNLRKAHLLDETSEEVRNLLIVMYQKQNFPIEAQYLKNFDPRVFKQFVDNQGATSASGCSQNDCQIIAVPFSSHGFSFTRAAKILENEGE